MLYIKGTESAMQLVAILVAQGYQVLLMSDRESPEVYRIDFVDPMFENKHFVLDEF
jgi:hypothetical protein